MAADAPADRQYRRFDFACPTVADIDDVDWDHVIGLACSDEGVVFVEFDGPKPGALVLKGTMQAMAELFSTRVASKLGITAPRIGFFRKSANAHIVDALARAQNALGINVTVKLRQMYILKMDYLRGRSLTSIPGDIELAGSLRYWFRPLPLVLPGAPSAAVAAPAAPFDAGAGSGAVMPAGPPSRSRSGFAPVQTHTRAHTSCAQTSPLAPAPTPGVTGPARFRVAAPPTASAAAVPVLASTASGAAAAPGAAAAAGPASRSPSPGALSLRLITTSTASGPLAEHGDPANAAVADAVAGFSGNLGSLRLDTGTGVAAPARDPVIPPSQSFPLPPQQQRQQHQYQQQGAGETDDDSFTPLPALTHPAAASSAGLGSLFHPPASASTATATGAAVSEPPFLTALPPPATEGELIMRQIGAIVALDLLCNNTDRLPFLSDNLGNPGNIMLAAHGPAAGQVKPHHADEVKPLLQRVEVMALDNGAVCIVPSVSAAYLRRLDRALVRFVKWEADVRMQARSRAHAQQQVLAHGHGQNELRLLRSELTASVSTHSLDSAGVERQQQQHGPTAGFPRQHSGRSTAAAEGLASPSLSSPSPHDASHPSFLHIPNAMRVVAMLEEFLPVSFSEPYVQALQQGALLTLRRMCALKTEDLLAIRDGIAAQCAPGAPLGDAGAVRAEYFEAVLLLLQLRLLPRVAATAAPAAAISATGAGASAPVDGTAVAAGAASAPTVSATTMGAAAAAGAATVGAAELAAVHAAAAVAAAGAGAGGGLGAGRMRRIYFDEPLECYKALTRRAAHNVAVAAAKSAAAAAAAAAAASPAPALGPSGLMSPGVAAAAAAVPAGDVRELVRGHVYTADDVAEMFGRIGAASRAKLQQQQQQQAASANAMTSAAAAAAAARAIATTDARAGAGEASDDREDREDRDVSAQPALPHAASVPCFRPSAATASRLSSHASARSSARTDTRVSGSAGAGAGAGAYEAAAKLLPSVRASQLASAVASLAALASAPATATAPAGAAAAAAVAAAAAAAAGSAVSAPTTEVAAAADAVGIAAPPALPRAATVPVPLCACCAQAGRAPTDDELRVAGSLARLWEQRRQRQRRQQRTTVGPALAFRIRARQLRQAVLEILELKEARAASAGSAHVAGADDGSAAARPLGAALAAVTAEDSEAGTVLKPATAAASAPANEAASVPRAPAAAAAAAATAATTTGPDAGVSIPTVVRAPSYPTRPAPVVALAAAVPVRARHGGSNSEASVAVAEATTGAAAGARAGQRYSVCNDATDVSAARGHFEARVQIRGISPPATPANANSVAASPLNAANIDVLNARVAALTSEVQGLWQAYKRGGKQLKFN